MKKGILFLALFSIAFVSCKNEEKANADTLNSDSLNVTIENTDDEISDSDKDDIVSHWSGKYVGTIPCVSCEGIITTLELRNDMSYTASSMFTDRDKKPVDFDGKFNWIEPNKMFELDTAGDGRKFLLVEEGIIPLDRDGKEFIAPEKTDVPDNGKYFLKKQ